MKGILHGLAMIVIVLVSSLALLVQVAHVDQQIQRVTQGSEAGR